MRASILILAGSMACAGTGTPEGAIALCGGEVDPDLVIDIDPDGPDTQIHATVAVDRAGVWVAWNRPDAEGGFDVWLTHLACDGTRDVPPQRVSRVQGNDVDPAIAVGDDRVIVVWQSDDGSGTEGNLSVRWRVYDLDGEPVSDVVVMDETRSAWMPHVARGLEGFVVVGARSNGTVFEIFRTDVDVDGVAVDGPSTISEDPDAEGSVWPRIAVDDGDVHTVWQRGDDVVYEGPSGTEVWTGPFGVPDVAAAEGAVQVTLPGEGGIRSAVPGAPPTEPLLPGTAAAIDWGPGGTWLFVLQPVEGLAHRGVVARYDRLGLPEGRVSLGAPTLAPYGPELAIVDPFTAVVVWQEGDNPAFRAKARFLQ